MVYNVEDMKAFTFQEQFNRQAEMFELAVGWLNSRQNVMSVSPANKEEERRGIDLKVLMISGKKNLAAVSIQVKVDFNISVTANLAVETVSAARWNGAWKPGWLSLLHNSQLLLYVCGNTGTYRLYDSQQFYERVMNVSNNCRAFSALNGSEDGGDYWYGMGILVPHMMLDTVMLDAGDIKSDSEIPRNLKTSEKRSAMEGVHSGT